MPVEFRLPELGENIDSGDLVRVLVSVGDVVQKDQAVLELETDKATIEVPSPVSGRVSRIHVQEGSKIKVGELILTLEDGAGAKAEAKPAATPTEEKKLAEAKPAAAQPPAATASTPARPAVASASVPVPVPAAPPQMPEARRATAAPAAPSVRRLARELGVEISEVPGTGPGGRISIEDVKAYAKSLLAMLRARVGAVPAAAEPLPDFSRWGLVERQPMSNVRRKTAEHLAAAWSTIPHVTQYDRADVTALDELRKQMNATADAKVTVTAMALKVVAAALAKFPQFAASVDMARQELVFKKYVHIGVAVDTDRGLLVPVIRDADKKTIFELATELARLAERARSRKLTLEEMAGGVFTITNLGGIGGTGFSPIVNAPEVAILGMARSSWEPVHVGGQFVARLMLPLSLSYDHRVIDGADAARFLRWVAEALENPAPIIS